MGTQNVARDRTDAMRLALQTLGVAAREDIQQNHWVDQAIAGIPEADNCIVTDCRFVNEADALVANGFLLARIDIDEEVRQTRLIARDGQYNPAQDQHISETALLDYNFPFRVDNSAALIDAQDNLRVLINEFFGLDLEFINE